MEDKKLEKNPYEEAVVEDNSVAETPTNTTSNNQSTYDYLRSQSAKELLDSNIQMSVARQNSQKALSGQMASMGLGNSGYASSAATGIQNAYMQGLASNQANYADQINTINQNEAASLESNDSNNVNALAEFMSGAESEDELNSYLNNYGISYDKETNSFSGEGWDKLSTDQQRLISSYYKLYSNSIGKQNDYSSITELMGSVSNYDQLQNVFAKYDITIDDNGDLTGEGYDKLSASQKKQLSALFDIYSDSLNPGYDTVNSALASWTMANGESANQGTWGLNNEISYIFSPEYMDGLKNGTAVKLVNGNASDTNYMYVVYRNGKWYVSSSSAYNKATEKRVVKNGEDATPRANNDQNEQGVMHPGNNENPYNS